MDAFCNVIQRGDFRLSVCFVGVWLYAQLTAADMKSGREKKTVTEWELFVCAATLRCRPGTRAPLLGSCVDCCCSLRHLEKVLRQSQLAVHLRSLRKKYGRLSGGQALQGGICQKRPRFVQEMQGKHSERFSEDGHHGAGNVATSRVCPSEEPYC